jgi:hypothetical protein
VRVVALTKSGKDLIVPIFRKHSAEIARVYADANPKELQILENVLKKAGKGVENGCTGGATACQAGRLDTLSTRNGLGEPLHCALGRLECRRGHLVEKSAFR